MYIFKGSGYDSVAILDDIASAEVVDKAQEVFEELGTVIKQSGLEEKESKAHAPKSGMPFLGVQFKTKSPTLEVTPERVEEILELVSMWKTKEKATRKEVESLFGKLNFIASVVHPGRIFMSRILSFLKSLLSYGLHRIPQFLRKILNGGRTFSRDIMASLWWPLRSGLNLMQYLHQMPASLVVVPGTRKRVFIFTASSLNSFNKWVFT